MAIVIVCILRLDLAETSAVPPPEQQAGEAEVADPPRAQTGLSLKGIDFTFPSLLSPFPPKLSSISHSLCLNLFKEEKCNKINSDCFL